MSEGVLDAVALVVVAVVLLALLHPGVSRREGWRATVTPLASIIGSGFLVVGPLLADVTGPWAPLAMAALCALAWLFGMAVRFNIEHAEPLRGDETAPRFPLALDHAADLCLAFAYFVSVTYYLNLLGAYLLKGAGIVDPAIARVATSVVVVGLGIVGLLRGFRGLERIEIGAVSFKLAVIAGIVLVLALALWPGSAAPRALPHAMGESRVHALRILLGCVILVQGFETSRFLGKTYPASLRIRSMRWAQLLSAAIYVVFIALVLPHVPSGHPGSGAETEIVDIVAGVASALGPLLVLAALASQLSAAVADMSGAGGLIADFGGRRIPDKAAYAAIAAVAVVLTWSTDIFGLIAYASRAFAVYYALQSALAFVLARGDARRRAVFATGFLFAAAVVVFGTSAE